MDCIEEVGNVWARAAILVFDQPEKHEIGRGRWDLAFCQVLLNSFQRSQRRSWECLRLIRGKDGHLGFQIGPKKNHTELVEGVEILLPVKFHWIPCSVKRRMQKCLSQSEARAAVFVFRSARKNSTVEDVEIFFPVKFCWIGYWYQLFTGVKKMRILL